MNIELALITQPLLLSVKTISVSALLFIVLGVPLAYLLSKENLKLKWLLDTIVTMPLILRPIAVCLFLLLLLGRD